MARVRAAAPARFRGREGVRSTCGGPPGASRPFARAREARPRPAATAALRLSLSPEGPQRAAQSPACSQSCSDLRRRSRRRRRSIPASLVLRHGGTGDAAAGAWAGGLRRRRRPSCARRRRLHDAGAAQALQLRLRRRPLPQPRGPHPRGGQRRHGRRQRQLRVGGPALPGAARGVRGGRARLPPGAEQPRGRHAGRGGRQAEARRAVRAHRRRARAPGGAARAGGGAGRGGGGGGRRRRLRPRVTPARPPESHMKLQENMLSLHAFVLFICFYKINRYACLFAFMK